MADRLWKITVEAIADKSAPGGVVYKMHNRSPWPAVLTPLSYGEKLVGLRVLAKDEKHRHSLETISLRPEDLDRVERVLARHPSLSPREVAVAALTAAVARERIVDAPLKLPEDVLKDVAEEFSR